MKLERIHIQSWEDLANAFFKYYKYNLDMAPDRYVQRWTELAAQVQPPLLDKELVDMFMSTLQSPYFGMMVGSASLDFSDLMKVG